MKHYLNDLIVILACCLTVAIVTFIESDRVDKLQEELARVKVRIKVIEEIKYKEVTD